MGYLKLCRDYLHHSQFLGHPYIIRLLVPTQLFPHVPSASASATPADGICRVSPKHGWVSCSQCDRENMLTHHLKNMINNINEH